MGTDDGRNQISKLTLADLKIQMTKKTVSFLRHAAWVSPVLLNSKLNIIGCGATGSNIAMMAARMGFTKFQLWDADIVEDHNLPNQAFMFEHIGMKKVEALKALLLAFNPENEVEIHNEFFTTEKHKELLDGILVLTVDTMSGRKDIYDSFYMNSKLSFVVETKLGWDFAEVHLLDPFNDLACTNWYKMLVDDKDVPEGPCNLRICTTMVNLVSSYVVHKLCQKISLEDKNLVFNYKARTMIDFSDELNIIQIKERK